MRRISLEPLLILYCYLLPFHLQSFNGYMTPCTYAIIWIKNRGYRIETQSRLPTLRFARSIFCTSSSRQIAWRSLRSANAPQISVGYTIDCLFYAVTPLFVVLCYWLLVIYSVSSIYFSSSSDFQCSLCRFPDCSMLSKLFWRSAS